MRHPARSHLLCALLCALLAGMLAPRAAYAYDAEPALKEARAAVVMDARGNVLYQKDGDVEMPMASITKVMTAVVALDSGKPLDEPLSYILNPVPEGSQLAGYQDGDPTTLRELLMTTLVYSGNDAASGVAMAVSGSIEEFVALMNAKANELGLEHTHYMNPHGMEEPGHFSCAADLCRLGRYAMENYPFIRQAVTTPEVTIVAGGKELTLASTDELMASYAGLRGIKTGNTESGASFLGSARRGHVTLYSCVLCCETLAGRFDDTRVLLDWAFEHYPQVDLVHRAWTLGVAPWQDGFWLRLPIATQRNAVAQRYVDGGAVEERRCTLPAGTMVYAGATYGTSVWEQDGRLAESATYVAQAPTSQDLAWNPLALPLFAH